MGDLGSSLYVLMWLSQLDVYRGGMDLTAGSIPPAQLYSYDSPRHCI